MTIRKTPIENPKIRALKYVTFARERVTKASHHIYMINEPAKKIWIRFDASYG
jgi:hypothetical protein